MIFIPLGECCGLAQTLNALNKRNKAYPFDWAQTDFINNSNVFYNIVNKSDSEIENFVVNFFNPDINNNKMYVKNYINMGNNQLVTENYFYNGEYDMHFPHIANLDTRIEDFTRKFKRLKDDFYSTDKVIILLICWDKNYTENILEFVDKLLPLKENIHFYVVNGMSQDYKIDKKYDSIITSEYIEKSDITNEYIHQIYNPRLLEKLTLFINKLDH